VSVKCSKCGSDDVIAYMTEATAICPSCCEKTVEHADGESGHVFKYARSEGYTCDHCGVEPDDQWYADRADY